MDKTERKPDENALINNLRNGFIACILTTCYVESCLNTLLRDTLGFSPTGKIIRGNDEAKLEIIFKGNEDAFSAMKADECWRSYYRIKKMRNALVHYKNNCANSASSYPPLFSWKIGGELISEFFTKKNIELCISGVERFILAIANQYDMTISPYVKPLTSNGQLGSCSYLCSKASAKEISDEMAQYGPYLNHC